MEARKPNVAGLAGRYVALDLATGVVLADAATLLDLADVIRARGVRASIVRVPRDEVPVLIGAG